MHNFKSAFRKTYFGARAAKGPHPNEALWHFLSVACHRGHSAGHASFSVGLARPPCPGMCIIIQQVNKNIAIGNCKLAKSQKETNTNNRSGHARQRGEQRSRSQSSHLFCYCHSHSAPQCTSCPLHRICVLRPQINDFAGLPTGRTYILRRLHNQFHAYARATSYGIRHDCAGPPLCVVHTFCAVCITNSMGIRRATWVIHMRQAGGPVPPWPLVLAAGGRFH